MDAEEKKLSPSAEAGQFQSSRADFKLHYFPDIPVDDPDNVRVCLPPEDKFQRIRYADGQPYCSNSSAGSENTQSRAHKNSSATERFDVQAYQDGFKDGLGKGTDEGQKAGFEQAAKELEPALRSLQQGLLQLKNLRQDTQQNIENEIVELALAIASKVVCREIKLDREVVACVAREALAKVEAPGRIKIKLNSSDLQFIDKTKNQLSDLVGNIDNVILEAEDRIQRGGCVIETDLGEIDARIEKQLQVVEESFRSALGKSTDKV